MILVGTGNNHPLLQEAYALRARILHDRLGWKVTVVGGLEMDELDDDLPTHMLYLIDDVLKGYLRLLPTVGPTMLHRYFSDVFKEQLAAPDIWEVSKFCLDVPKSDLAYHFAVMMAGLGQFCWRHDIKSLTGIVNRQELTAYNRGGINLTILETTKLDDKPIHNTVYQMTEENLKTMSAWFVDKILDDATLVYT